MSTRNSRAQAETRQPHLPCLGLLIGLFLGFVLLFSRGFNDSLDYSLSVLAAFALQSGYKVYVAIIRAQQGHPPPGGLLYIPG